MSGSLRGLFVVLGLSCCMAAARASLVFESETIRANAAPAEEIVQVRFHFVNTGEKPIEISEVKSSCGCLRAESDQRVYKPREKGTVTGLFKLGAFEGEVSKTLFVISDDPADRKRRLTVTIAIPKLFEISPEVTSWSVGEEPKPKSISFKVLQETPVDITGVTSTRQNFTAEVRPIEKGRSYEIVLTPQSTADPVLGALRIETTASVPRYRHRLVFFNVLRAKPATVARP